MLRAVLFALPIALLAAALDAQDTDEELEITVTAAGTYRVNGRGLIDNRSRTLAAAIRKLAPEVGEGRVRIRLALPGERRGRVLVDDGSGRPLPVHVRFESALELSAAGVQIQDSPADRSG